MVARVTPQGFDRNASPLFADGAVLLLLDRHVDRAVEFAVRHACPVSSLNCGFGVLDRMKLQNVPRNPNETPRWALQVPGASLRHPGTARKELELRSAHFRGSLATLKSSLQVLHLLAQLFDRYFHLDRDVRQLE